MKQTPLTERHNADVLNFLRRGYAKVVEVGSGSGALAQAYRQLQPNCAYIGLEIDPAHAEASRQYCTDVIHGNVEQLPDLMLAQLADADCWVFADSLEHLHDPWRMLKRIRANARPGLTVIACIPNAQNWSVQIRLNSGQFRYQNSGLLDRTHLRWLTRLTILEMFESAGFQVEEMIARTVQHPKPEITAAIRHFAEVTGIDADMAESDAIPSQYVLRAVVVERPDQAPTPAEPELESVHLYAIAYSPQTLAAVEPGYQVLDHVANERSDWREYWPIRKFLLSEPLAEDHLYGFFSPRLKEKTGLTPAKMHEFIASAGSDVDVVTFSPQPDMGALFLNVFEQEEVFQAGFISLCEKFLRSIGMEIELKPLIMDSRQIIFSNYFAARPAFWREWLAINERLFALCEGPDSELKRELTAPTDYPGGVQRKIFLMERIAPLLLTLQPHWKVRAYNTFACAWSDTALNQHKHEAVLSDALKIAMREQGFPQYVEAFVALRNKLRASAEASRPQD